MAGQGIKLFASGDVLSAAEINGYLMDQAVTRFATTAARDAAFGGANQPTLSEGRICYIDTSNLIQFYDGTQWQDSSQFTVTDGAITTAKLADDAVTGAKIADNAITAAHIADGTIIAADIADGSVTSAKILDGTIVDADINATAAIALSKLATGALPTAITVASANMVDGTIVNADINAAAAIALSKLASGTSGQIVVHSSGGVPTATTVSGDVTIDSTGNVQIAADKIVNADVNASAAIAYSKLNLGTSIVNADVSTTAAIAYSKLNLGTSIVNADVSTTAAVDLGKLADATIDIKTANYPLVLTDKNKFIKMNSSSNRTITVPLQATVNFPEGSQIQLIRYGSGTLEIVGESGAVILYATPGNFLRAQYSSATLLKCDTNIWMLMGDLSAS